MFAAAANDRLEKGSLIEAALVASGATEPAVLERYRAQFESLRDQLLLHHLLPGEGRGEGDTLEKIHLIHHLLHTQLLERYDASATDLGGTFDTGTYNCASATLLFVALAGRIDLKASGIELPGHVRAIVAGEDARYEVEVTCPAWGQAVRRTEPSSAGKRQSKNSAASMGWLGSTEGSPQRVETGGSAALDPSHPSAVAEESQREDRPGREVLPAGLVAMVYYNRGVDAFNDRRFGDAVEVNRKALLLDPENRAARGNLLASVNNWALALCDAGHYGEAQSLLAAGRRFDPTHEAFFTNAAHVERVSTQAHANSSI
jgi:hypothetical protein